MKEEIKCKDFHVWPETSENMEGMPCQCQRMLWHQETCGCPGEKKLEFKPIPNPDYKGQEN